MCVFVFSLWICFFIYLIITQLYFHNLLFYFALPTLLINLPCIIFLPKSLIDQFYKNYLIFTENTRAFRKKPNNCKLDSRICYLFLPWYPLLSCLFSQPLNLSSSSFLFCFCFHFLLFFTFSLMFYNLLFSFNLAYVTSLPLFKFNNPLFHILTNTLPLFLNELPE